MEADIILDRFLQLESMSGLRYCWMIGNGDSSMYNSMVIHCTTLGIDVLKVAIECTNHAVNCYRNRLEQLWNDKSWYRGNLGYHQQRWSNSLMEHTVQSRCTVELVISTLPTMTWETVFAITSGCTKNIALHSAIRNDHLVTQQVIWFHLFFK